MTSTSSHTPILWLSNVVLCYLFYVRSNLYILPNCLLPFLAAAGLLVFSFVAGSVITNATDLKQWWICFNPKKIYIEMYILNQKMFITLFSHYRTLLLFFGRWLWNRKYLISAVYLTLKWTFAVVFIHLSLQQRPWFCLSLQQHLELGNYIELWNTST